MRNKYSIDEQLIIKLTEDELRLIYSDLFYCNRKTKENNCYIKTECEKCWLKKDCFDNIKIRQAIMRKIDRKFNSKELN